MSLKDLLPQLDIALEELNTEISNWQALDDDLWVDVESLQQIVNQLEQDASTKADSLNHELSSLYQSIEQAFQLNQEQFDSVKDLYEQFSELITEFGSNLEEQHVPDFDFSYESVEEEVGAVIDSVGEAVEVVLTTFENDISQRFDQMRADTSMCTDEVRSSLEDSLEAIQDKVFSVQSSVIDTFENKKSSLDAKQSDTSDKFESLKVDLNQHLDSLLSSITSNIQELRGSFDEIGQELDSMQQNIQYTMDTASDCMKMCGVGMNAGANSLNTVKSCLDGVV